MTPKRVTVRDIGLYLGLHFTTVAEALRGSPRISSKTRERVKEAAVLLGYKADPVMSALSAYGANNRRQSFRGVLAWINGFPDKDHFAKDGRFYGDCYTGAKARSEELGFKLETICVADPDMTPERTSDILHSRNVAGVIVAPLPLGLPGFELRWDQFRSVRIGQSKLNTRLTTIRPDQFGNLRMIYERLLGLGFVRIGFACTQEFEDRVDNLWSGSFWASQSRLNPSVQVTPHIDQGASVSKKAFLKWLSKEKPEVVICGGAQRYHGVLKEEGIDVPNEVQLVHLNADSSLFQYAGIRQNGRAIGATSVDYLNGAISRFEVGLETYPRDVALMGEWGDGFSLDETLLPCNRSGEALN